MKEDITQEVLSGEVIGYNAFLSADKVYSVDDLMGVVRKFIAENDEYESASYVVRELPGIDYDAIPDLPQDGAPLAVLRDYVANLPEEVHKDAEDVLNMSIECASHGDASELVPEYLDKPGTFKKCYCGRTKIGFACDVAALMFKIEDLEFLEDYEEDEEVD